MIGQLMKNIVRYGLMIAVFFWASAQAVNPLPVAEAFQLTTQVSDSQHVKLIWQIAPHYHLYSDAFKISVLTPNTTLADWQLPDGKMAYDPSRGQYLEYRDRLVLPLTLTTGSAEQLQLKVSFQGCADLGFCYPPQTQTLNLDSTVAAPLTSASHNLVTASTDLSSISAILAKQSLAGIWLAFFVFGLLLAFTPCVFPMLPILSSIIIGHGAKLSSAKAFTLSLIYVLASACTYALAGVMAGLAGNHWQSALQNPWVLGIGGLLLSALSLSLFGFYELQLPLSWQQRLNTFSRNQNGGSYWGALIMGVLASLIVSPCVSAPLVGALAFIGESGSAWLGGSALLMMGLGMGLPLLLFGMSAGKWLPRAGLWMGYVKSIFGVSLVWMSIDLWGRFLPGNITLGLFSLLCITLAVYLGAFEAAKWGWSRLWKGLGLALALYGACLMIGALTGAEDAARPLAKIQGQASPSTSQVSAATWRTVNSEAQLEVVLATAKTLNQPVLLDFSADWCVSCTKLKRDVLDQLSAQQALQANQWTLVRVDVTHQSADVIAIEQRYQVVAPPTLVFINRQGLVLTDKTLVGEQSLNGFLQQLASI